MAGHSNFPHTEGLHNHGSHTLFPGCSHSTAESTAVADEKLFHERSLEVLPWIESPLKYASGDDLYFHPRKEASMIELFFDLFFVANLATFTALHEIIDLDTLWAYLGFFTIIWFTWLQITVHDARFAIDSFYERVCKFLQFLVFGGFALAGYNFEPTSGDGLAVYETLCFVLFVSRMLLTVQYSVVLVYVTKSSSTLVKPLLFIVGTFVLSSGGFLAMIIASHTGASTKIFYFWYILSFFEAVSVLSISAKWSPLGFRKTHLLERMGLLSMIVVGEGVIGVTKTIGKLMGSTGPDIRSIQQVTSIIAVLMFLWQIYFDNHPHEHLGAIREVLWVALHFPLHVAFVGIVEGAQQLAIAWKTWQYFKKFDAVVTQACSIPGLRNQDLVDTLNTSIYSFGFTKNIFSAVMLPSIKSSLTLVNDTANVCALNFFENSTLTALSTGITSATPLDTLSQQVLGSFYLYNGMQIPKYLNGNTDPTPADVYYSAYFVVFGYVFCSLAIMLVTSAVSIFFVRRYRRDIFENIRIGVRVVAMGICIGVANSRNAVIPAFRNHGLSMIVTVAVILMVIMVDRVATSMGILRVKKTQMSSIRIYHENEVAVDGTTFLVEDSKSHEHTVVIQEELEVEEKPRPDSSVLGRK